MHTKRTRVALFSCLLATSVVGGLLSSASAHAIGGGGPAPADSYRFIAQIYTGERECTAALIDVEWLLTASSCFAQDPDNGFPVEPGEPAQHTTALIGSPDLVYGDGQVRSITTLVPREDRDLVLARLHEPVLDITPIPISTTPPEQGEVLTVAGYGRTTEDWYPDKLHTSTFSVAARNQSTIDLAPAAEDAAICKGDAGGPAVRAVDGGLELVGIHSKSWQHGCLGVTETRTGAVDTRLDDIAGWLERSPVQRRIASDPTLPAEIGTPVGPEVIDWPYRYREFERGQQRARLYWSADTGDTQFIRGAILAKYLALGGHRELGSPTTDETFTADGVGAYNNISRNVCRSSGTQAQQSERSRPDAGTLSCTKFGSISHSPDTGAHYLNGSFYFEWEKRGREAGLGYPTTEETATTDSEGKPGRYARFRKDGSPGTLYWRYDIGTRAVYGAIDERWTSYGREKGGLGVPRIDVTATPDGIGRYVHFTRNASIYWTPDTGAWEVHGAIRQKWASMGWERSYLGYPISNEQRWERGARSYFQGGRIDYISATGEVIAYRN
ncbi:trypsin-like serine protease [Amycolatopsis aidingensis]|uniref:trypsin-like serine protease n=1 Tax=Amycolatopsis aidingensis TaxID=2842453 RepID=UPI001C0AB4E8|nr:trypsin-like serine protease [Amycolatopsis aidingensis]